MDLEQIRQLILEMGAYRAGVVAVEDIDFQPDFRKLCENNVCGMYGRSWMCPPLVGDVDELIASLKRWQWAVVYQTVDALEDRYDFEAMMAAGTKMNRLTARIRRELTRRGVTPTLMLGAGGCRVCQRCAKLDGQPCRSPEEAIPSLEAYGINVSALAPRAGMKYINGPDTVTYFGTVFLEEGTAPYSR